MANVTNNAGGQGFGHSFLNDPEFASFFGGSDGNTASGFSMRPGKPEGATSSSFVYISGGGTANAGSSSGSTGNATSAKANSDSGSVTGESTANKGQSALVIGDIEGDGVAVFDGEADAGDNVDASTVLFSAGDSTSGDADNEGPSKVSGFSFGEKDTLAQTGVTIDDSDDLRGESIGISKANGGDTVRSESKAKESQNAEAEAEVNEDADGGSASANAVAGPTVKADADVSDPGDEDGPSNIFASAESVADRKAKTVTAITDPTGTPGDASASANAVANAGPDGTGTLSEARAVEGSEASTTAAATAFEGNPDKVEAFSFSNAGPNGDAPVTSRAATEANPS